MNFFKKITTNISLFFSKIYLFFDRYLNKKFKDKVLFKKILFTLFIMTIFIVIGTLTLPGITVSQQSLENTNSFLGIMNTIGGGGLRRFSLVSLGISPFISSSLVMMFLQTKLFPPVHRLYQSGPSGRIKLNYITFSLTFFFSFIQAVVVIQSLTQQSSIGISSYISIENSYNNNFYIWFVLPIILIAGTFLSIFLAEQITNKGVGNGTSLLILSGSIISLPNLFTSAWNAWISPYFNNQILLSNGIIYFICFVLLFILIILIVLFVYQAERRIPIQQTGVGRSKNVNDLSYLPIKLNPSGIMPIIFASMLVTFPMMIVNLVDRIAPSAATRWTTQYFSLTNPLGLTIFVSATFALSIFLSLQQSKIDKIVEDFNKASTFIPGIRPGEQTEDYLISVVLRLAIFSAFYLTILGSSQYVAIMLGANQSLVMSGTTLMIIATVSLETIQQIQARYKVLNLFSVKRKKSSHDQNSSSDKDKRSSILW